MSLATWLVWSPRPPECLEKVSSASMLDAARAWAERQFRRGMLPMDGTEVHARCEGDATPDLATYRLRIQLVNAPAFRASFVGLAFEGMNGSKEGGDRGL